MKIGIGVTSYNRPATLAKFLSNLYEFTTYDYVLHIAQDTDEDRKGVAFRKNECLRALKDCDHIFLFDDDCSVMQKGWEKFFIDSKQEHLLYLDSSHSMIDMNLLENGQNLTIYRDCGGVFMYMTKAVVERVGAFDEKFGLYSFEHADYSSRILGGHGSYPMLAGTNRYLYSEDYNNPEHKSSITEAEKIKHVRANWDKWNTRDKNLIHIPL